MEKMPSLPKFSSEDLSALKQEISGTGYDVHEKMGLIKLFAMSRGYGCDEEALHQLAIDSARLSSEELRKRLGDITLEN